MFKKKCQRCNRKISKDFDFCPYCGMDFRQEKRTKRNEEYGLLGREDSLMPSMPDFNMKMPFGLNGLFNSLLKEVDKQFQEIDKEMVKDRIDFRKQNENIKKTPNSSGLSISISTTTGKNPEIKISGFGPEFKNMKMQETKEARISKPEISDEEARRISKLPKKEAETQVRRLSNKIIYEIKLPGVKSLKEVVINKLENSVEIKAFSEKTAYFKLLPINLPIINYKLKDSSLTIEFSPQ